MTYVMSDIHGEYDKYKQMLEKIDFSDVDVLYSLGDVIDRGPDSIRLLFDMSMRPNIIPIMGNHEYMAEYILRMTNVEITEETLKPNWNEKLVFAVHDWYQNGGESTSRAFHKLSAEERAYMIEYLQEFSLYEDITVGENRFWLVHAGLPNFHPEKLLDDYLEVLMPFTTTHYNRTSFPDRSIVTGHTPTFMIDPAYDGRIYQKNRHIALDCGVCHGKSLGCLRLDDFAEFYV